MNMDGRHYGRPTGRHQAVFFLIYQIFYNLLPSLTLSRTLKLAPWRQTRTAALGSARSESCAIPEIRCANRPGPTTQAFCRGPCGTSPRKRSIACAQLPPKSAARHRTGDKCGAATYLNVMLTVVDPSDIPFVQNVFGQTSSQ